MSFPSSPDLLLQAIVPGLIALALGAFLLAKSWVRGVGATLASVGLSLLSVVVLVMLLHGFTRFSGLAKSPLFLLGIPLGIFALALGLLLRRVQTSALASVLCAVAGVAGLYWLGGFVLMQSICSFHSGGC